MTASFQGLLREHLDALYPRGVDLPDAGLEMLDADIAGLATSYRDSGYLTVEQSKVLQACADELRGIEPDLPPHARQYFNRLGALARIIIEEAPVHGTLVI